MTEFDTKNIHGSEYRALYANRIDTALELDSFNILKNTNFEYGFNSSFDEMSENVMNGIRPGENNIVVLDLDGVFYDKSGYFKPLSESQRKWLENLKLQADVFVISSRRKNAATVIDWFNPMMDDLRGIIGAERVMINTKRQKERTFPLNESVGEDNYKQVVEQFTLLSEQIREKGGNANIIHVADTGHATSLRDNDLQMWNGDLEGKTELMAMKNFIELLQSLGVSVSKSEIQFIDHGKLLTKVGSVIMKHTGKRLTV